MQMQRGILRVNTGRLFALTVLLGWAGASFGAVGAGDIAIIGYQSDNPDRIAFVVLTQVASGETIRFTDSGWMVSGSFRANEGGIAFTAAANLSPGTVVVQSNPFTTAPWSVDNSGLGTGGFLLSGSGDQILAFQGTAASPSFVYAVTNDSTGWSDATSANTSAVPAGLTDGVTAVSIGEALERDNGFYNGITSGSPQALLAAISDPANWVTSDTVQTWPNWSFSVGAGGTPVITDVLVNGSAFDVGDPALVTVQLSNAPPVGSPATISVDSGAFVAPPANIVISDPDTSGSVNVTMDIAGTWTVDALPVSGVTGTGTSSQFSVGPVAPVVFAGADRAELLSGATLTISMIGASVSDANGLAGLTYEWTPAASAGIVGWTGRTGSVTTSGDPAAAQVTFDQTGVYDLTLTVTDPDLLVSQDTVQVTVTDTTVFGPPAGYYDPARPGGVFLTGLALKNALHNIIDNHIVRSFASARDSLQLLDQDPLDASRVIQMYTGQSVPGVWDNGVTWNREHQWPKGVGVGDTGPDNSELFNLRPADPVVNGARGSLPFGIGAGFWDPLHPQALPGVNDRGDASRSMFYMAVRYDGSDAGTVDLELVNGLGGGNQLGDLARMLEWHYSDPVDVIELRRNHLIFSSTDNPLYHQGNRNPFIDHPELVRSVFGDPPTFPFDIDASGAVDSIDYASFAACQQGPDQAVSYPCDLHDHDGDTFVDLFDFAEFQIDFSGP